VPPLQNLQLLTFLLSATSSQVLSSQAHCGPWLAPPPSLCHKPPLSPPQTLPPFTASTKPASTFSPRNPLTSSYQPQPGPKMFTMCYQSILTMLLLLLLCPATTSATCWEAHFTDGVYLPSPSCQGYESFGYSCTTIYCAILNPTGDAAACSQSAPDGYELNEAAGRCVPPDWTVGQCFPGHYGGDGREPCAPCAPGETRRWTRSHKQALWGAV